MRKNILIAACLVLISITLNAKVKLQHIEPMCWWVGMENPNLQLLVYGNDISSTKPQIDYPGIKINKISQVKNANYLFIDLIISANAKPGTFDILFTNGKKTVASYKYELKARNQKKNIHQGFSSADVMYLLMPDRFANGNPANDSTENTLENANRSNPDGRHGGDLTGVRNNLDYIADLGYTTIWLNPFLENNQEAYSYHGYAISNFYKVDPRLGTNLEFVQLVDEAHETDLKIVMDMIFNHCGSEHWFIKDLPMENWVHQHEEFTRSNFRAPTITDPYASKYDKNKMLTGWFDTNMPDFDQRNPLLATYLIQNSIWWVEYSGIDGFRVDTQPYPYKEFMAQWSEAIMNQYPNFNIVGEAWLQKIPISAYFQQNTSNKDGYNSHMPAITDFPMYSAISSAFNEEEGWSEGMAKLYYILAQDFAYADPSNLLIFTDNHDLTRIYESLNHDVNKLKMAVAFLLTTRGIPQMYYGTEILMDGKEHEGHGFIRKDFPGGWPNDKINAFTEAGRTDEQNDFFNYLKTILNWRKNTQAIHKGQLTHFLPEDGIYVYFRHNTDKTVMIVLNNNNSDTKTVNTARFNEIIGHAKTGENIITNEKIDNITAFEIAPKSAMIIELD